MTAQQQLATYYNAEYAKAFANPEQWIKDNKEVLKKAWGYRIMRRRLRREPAYKDLIDKEFGEEFITVSIKGGILDLTDEQKARLKRFLENCIFALKIIASAIPPPWNFGVMALSIFLALIVNNRLTPKEFALLGLTSLECGV